MSQGQRTVRMGFMAAGNAVGKAVAGHVSQNAGHINLHANHIQGASASLRYCMRSGQ